MVSGLECYGRRLGFKLNALLKGGQLEGSAAAPFLRPSLPPPPSLLPASLVTTPSLGAPPAPSPEPPPQAAR